MLMKLYEFIFSRSYYRHLKLPCLRYAPFVGGLIVVMATSPI